MPQMTENEHGLYRVREKAENRQNGAAGIPQGLKPTFNFSYLRPG
jgi:hypothetical protein